MGTFGRLFSGPHMVEAVLESELRKRGVPAAAFPPAVLRELAMHCASTAESATRFQKAARTASIFSRSANLHDQIAYTVRMFELIAAGAITTEALQARNASLYAALCRGLEKAEAEDASTLRA